jgi:uncharacterized protein YegP (UPF0339 family)
MMELKGQTVYVVDHFNREDIAQGYEVYASLADAKKAVEVANRKGKKYGDYAYFNIVTIS